MSSRPGIPLWDPDETRARIAARSIADAGAAPIVLSHHDSMPRLENSGCGIAVLALTDGDAFVPAGIAATLLAQGFKLVGYAPLARWPIAARCRVLLDGCSSLVDSGTPDFPSTLAALLTQLVEREADRAREDHALRAQMARHGVIGASAEMLAIFRWVSRVSALSDLPTLITGETGTGKEHLARALHQLDQKRRDGPFVAVNCGAISAGLAETELFGHRRGAFTGADRDRRGLIRSAHGGVLFLDEIGELSESLQTKLLRVLQEHRVLAVGDDHETGVNVRVIAATNRNLERMVHGDQFRADLFHRLSVLTVHVPPLRERRHDIGPLVEHFLDKHASLHGAPAAAGRDFIDALSLAELPGNARELENVVRRALVNKSDVAPLGLSDLPAEIWKQVMLQQPSPDVRTPAVPAAGQEGTSFVSVLERNGWNLSRSLGSCERSLLRAALDASNGNQAQTARLLGITPRSVYNKMRKHHLSI